MMAEDGREDEFAAVILQLQVVHSSRVQELKIKYEDQLSFHTEAAAEAKSLKAVVKRLKSAISASKIKIAQQALVISEQSILLRQAGCPRAFLLSNADNLSKDGATISSSKTPGKELVLNSTSVDHFNSNPLWSDSKYQDLPMPHNESCLDHGQDKFPNSEQTVLPCDQDEAESYSKKGKGIIPQKWNSVYNWVERSSMLDQTENNIQSTLSPLEADSCHIIYSHTHNLNPCQKPVSPISCAVRRGQGTGSSSVAAAIAARYPTRGLSLQSSSNSSRVRYRKAGHEIVSKLLPSSNNGATNDTRKGDVSDCSSQSSSDACTDSIPASPSFLTDSANMLMPSFGEHSEREGDNENPLEPGDEPMSCSMFTPCPQDTSGTTTTKMAGATLHQITLANTHSVILRKRPRKVNKIAELLSTKKRVRSKSSPDSSVADGDVVPVTPGARLVRNILDSEGWLAAQSPPNRGGRLGKNRPEGEDMGRGDGRGYFIKKKMSMDDGHLLTSSNNGQQQKCAAASSTGDEDDARPNRENLHALQESLCCDENKTASNQIHRILTNHPEQRPTTGTALVGDAKQSATDDINEDAMKMAKRTGLLTNYKCDTKILKKADRDKLDAKACPDCSKWFEDDGDMRAHLRNTCRHKALHLPPDSDPRMWGISFPNTEECDRLNM